MENYTVILSPQDQYVFQVGQYPHNAAGGFRYKIFRNGSFVPSLEPDKADSMHIRKNPAGLNLEIHQQRELWAKNFKKNSL